MAVTSLLEVIEALQVCDELVGVTSSNLRDNFYCYKNQII
jgi:hypothetical protein